MSWQIPFTWEGESVWILGGGPSVYKQFGIPLTLIEEVIKLKKPFSALSDYLAPIHNKRVIGINNAYKLGNWIDIIYFGDCAFYVANRIGLTEYTGIKITACPRFAKNTKERIRHIPVHPTKRLGICENPKYTAWNANSGSAALSLAAHLKCKRVFLLGFDMCADGKNTHWHGYHHFRFKRPEIADKRKKQSFERHLRGFPIIKQDAIRLGIDIFNVNPDSMIQEFPKITLKEALEMDNA